MTISDDPPSMPWDQRPSIYDHVCSHVATDQPGLTEGGETLPDEKRLTEDSRLRWAAGALDGVTSRHMGQGGDEELVNKTFDLIREYSDSPIASIKKDLYEHVTEGNTLSLIDSIIEAVVGYGHINHERLYELAYSFVTEAPDREPVKFGVAILGIFNQPENESLFQTLGRHEEFTLFCAVALANVSADPEQSLWTLARNVNGWGRIHVVERLAQTENVGIKNWLLRDGYRNSVMYEYLAYTCATAGGLLSALSEDTVDRELLTSAGEIIAALIASGPAENIDDYEDGAWTVEMFLSHMGSSAETLDDFVHVHTIKQFLDDEDGEWDDREDRDWTDERRNDCRVMCDRILNRPGWTEQARRGFTSDNDMDFHRAIEAAEALGLDTWETHWRRLQEKPTDSGRWYQVMARCDEDRIAAVIAFAEITINLGRIATGPADEIGLGPGWEQHQCLDFVLQALRKFAGQGHRLIQAGLRSPVVCNRNMAVAAMSTWGHDQWDDDLRGALEAAAVIEPQEDVRERMEKTLRGEPLEG